MAVNDIACDNTEGDVKLSKGDDADSALKPVGEWSNVKESSPRAPCDA